MSQHLARPRHPVLLGWFAGVVVVSSLLAWPHIRSNRGYTVTATRLELHRETLSLVAAALCWTALPITLAGIDGKRDQS
ncbi:MAG: hypothetical protein IPP45_14380 [Sphingomonadales bacterium]|nr:hypothetical protein [Sphingomonadales bacterium]